MMSALIVSVSGIRGVVGQGLTPEVAMRFAAAFASQVPEGTILLARDGRASGKMLGHAVNSALLASGRNVLDLNVAATPTVGVMVRQIGAAGAMQITASHNPPAYNGLKLFGPDGRVLPAAEGERVAAAFHENLPKWQTTDGLGNIRVAGDELLEHHLRQIVDLVDVKAIRDSKFSVVLDANHGAGGALGKRLLEHLGCEVVILGAQADGQFEHSPEPTESNVQSVLSRVVENGAHIGFCQDPDADRLAVIDEKGRYIGEEFTLALCVSRILASSPGPVVTNCATSRMVQDIAERHGVPFHRSAVGEANVVDLMLKVKAVIGGEGNGGVIHPRVGWVRDSFVGMALILELMARESKTISQIVQEIPHYSMEKQVLPFPAERLEAAFSQLQGDFSNAMADRQDGLRLDWPDRWLSVRASNTEPIVRLMSEAPTAESASELCAEARQILEQIPSAVTESRGDNP